MNKKIIILILFLLIFSIGIGVFLIHSHSKDNRIDESNNYNDQNSKNNDNNEGENMISDNGSSIVVYFSATGTTKKIAEFISEITNSNMIEIMPLEEYTNNDLNYTNNNSRANKEQNDSSSRPEISNTINLDNYDTIYLGYPIWWGDVPKIILTFLDTYNLEGKTVIPFCTSGSSGISGSMKTLKEYNKNVNWIEGRRFGSSSSKTEVESWIKEIK